MSRERVVILMYDICMKTKDDKKNYSLFHKAIHRMGFIMLQESIYYKYIRNIDNSNKVINRLKFVVPKNSNIKILILTLMQFEEMNKNSNQKINLDKIKNNIIIV